jgi:phosphopantothenoylcysteine decarboxylase / phosphopantothenate---cysteine ligase
VPGHDVFIAVAAVADWRVANVSVQKLKKDGNGGMPALEFEQNPDILASVAALSNKPYCVGFAAESENLLEYGRAKRERKGIPLLAGNIGPQTFGSDRNELILFDEHGHVALPAGDKLQLARRLISEIARRLVA